MKKIKYFIILVLLFLLTGCDLLFEDFRVTFHIQDNIKIPISEYENFNWNKVITIKYNNKEVALPNENVKLISGTIAIGEMCKHEATLKTDYKVYSETFYVKIIADEYRIKDLATLSTNKTFGLTGTISNVNEIGFILTDETASVFVKKDNANSELKENDVINASCVFNSKGNKEILLQSFEKINKKINKTVPTNINNDETSILLNQFNTFVKHIRFEGIVYKENETILIKSGSVNFELPSEAVLENNEILKYIDKKILVSGWIYQKNSSNNLIMMLDKVEHVYNNETIGDRPVIQTSSSYYCYYNRNNVNDFTSYFKISDDKDGSIKPTIDMISGNINNEQNIISLKVSDSNGNVAIEDIIIEVNDYSGVETNESIEVIDKNAMPSKGNVKVLVIPVDLSDNPATPEMRSNIEKAFFGTEEDTGWESLKSYYEESSYGNLSITGEVTNWYTPKHNSYYYANYEDEDNYLSGSTLLMNEALTHFKSNYNYSDFDSNKDGYIDAVYLVYNNNIGGNGLRIEEDFYWAYTYWDFYADKRNYSDTLGYSYVFMSYDFFKEDLAYSSQKLKLNCETLIHETGHLFNLEDYYDYDEYDKYSNDGGYCGSDMMDYNFGDHGPFSKIMLDWVNPVEITRNGIYELPSFTTSGVSFIIGANNKFDSIFDEYYLIDFYTFDGLNKLQSKDFFKTSNNYAGVRISHVNASLTYEEGYYPIYTYNNTDTQHKLIRMLEADYNGRFDLNSSLSNGATLKDFYQTQDMFGINQYAYYKSSKNNPLPFTMKVLSLNNNSATIEIIFK